MATLTESEIIFRLNSIFPGKPAAQMYQLFKDILTDVSATETSITNLNAWATALADKLNADAGVTDADYDTDPQA